MQIYYTVQVFEPNIVDDVLHNEHLILNMSTSKTGTLGYKENYNNSYMAACCKQDRSWSIATKMQNKN